MVDPDELRYPSYDVVIQRASDGDTRTYHDSLDWGQGSWSWWTEGNQGCDCNRELSFRRAAGEQPGLDITLTCGDSAYRVLRFEFPDGTSIPGPEAAIVASVRQEAN